MNQISLFDGDKPLKIDKPIRLIELFAGYGSQHFALKYLGANFVSWKICEWAVKSIQAYKDAHFANDNTDYSRELTKEQVIDFLFRKGISSNYNDPMKLEQIKRLGEEKTRNIYNNLIATHNLVSVCNCKAEDLEIVETDKYTYIMTYSFPCQDLSKAGKGKGMAKNSGTRSGLLWEVKRILDECKELPQILIMENVPDIIGEKNVKIFASWVSNLDSLGYTSKWSILDANDYGIPQNRERCFMVSWLGNYYYDFPDKQIEKKPFYSFLDFDEKYLISNKKMNKTQRNCLKIVASKIEKDNSKTVRTSGRKSRDRHEWSVYSVDLRQSERFCGVLAEKSNTLCAHHRTSYTIDGRYYFDYSPKECFRLMGVKDEDFDLIAKNQSDSSLYHLAGDSIVVNVLMAIFYNMLNNN